MKRLAFRYPWGILVLVTTALSLVTIRAVSAQMGPLGVQIGHLYVELDADGAQDKYDRCMDNARAPIICQQVRTLHEHHDPALGVESRLSQAIMAIRARAKSGEYPDVGEFDRILRTYGISVFDVVDPTHP